MAFFQPGTPLRNKIGFFIGATIFLCGIGFAFWDQSRGEYGRSLIDFAVAMSPIAFLVIWGKWRASRDPAFARKMEETRARRRPQAERQRQMRTKSLMAHALGFALAVSIMFVAHEVGFVMPPSWHIKATTAFFMLYAVCTGTFLLVGQLGRRSQNAP